MVVSGLISSPAHAKDWPEFRGPTGQGIVREGTLPLEWSATRNVAWKQAIPGKGWSSPVVYDGRIYLTTSVPVAASREGDQSLQAICLDARTGKIQWAKEVIRQDGKTAPPIHNKNSHASPTPIVDGERLYVHFGHQGTACLDLSGEVLWRNTNLKYAPVHGNGGSPILAGDALVVSCDGGDQQFVVALNRATGRVMWKRKRGIEAPKKFAFSTPLLITVDGRQQVVSPGAAAVGAYDPSTGREIWRVRYDGYSVIPRPVYAHGLVFVSTGYETPSLLAIRPEGRGDVTETHVAWRTRRGVPHSASLVVAGDQLYMVSDAGVASCLDARTGRLHWQERLGGTYSSSPLVADGRIYFQSEDGTAVIIKAGTQFQQLARNELGERTLASYAVVDGALFIRTEENLYRIEAR
jgi:outer membrane protein assembly factor BamB